jgi:hypothetical protein
VVGEGEDNACGDDGSKDGKVDWDSEDDGILDIPNNAEGGFVIDFVAFLGFHPYKEVIFLKGEGVSFERQNGSVFRNNKSKCIQSWLLRIVSVHTILDWRLEIMGM